MRRHPLLVTAMTCVTAAVWYGVATALLSPDPAPLRASSVLIRIGGAAFFGGFMFVFLYFGVVRPSLRAESPTRPVSWRNRLLRTRSMPRTARLLSWVVSGGCVLMGAALLVGGIVYAGGWGMVGVGLLGLVLGGTGLVSTQRAVHRPAGDDDR